MHIIIYKNVCGRPVLYFSIWYICLAQTETSVLQHSWRICCTFLCIVSAMLTYYDISAAVYCALLQLLLCLLSNFLGVKLHLVFLEPTLRFTD